MKRQVLFTKFTIMLLVFVIGALCLASCGASKDADSSEGYYNGNSMENGSDSSDGGIGSIPSGGVDNPTAKIIKIAHAEMSTQEYDDFITTLYSKITEFGGYTDSETFSGGKTSRRASVTVRVPAEKLESFKEALSGLGTMNYYSADKQDVSLTYAVLQSEVETLTLEIGVVEELFEIAKGASDLTAISELEAKLTSLRLRLAEAQAKLSVYDNSIAYSTVYLTVYETLVKEPLPLPEEKGAFERIGENLIKAFKNIGNFFVEFFVFIISALPYLTVVAVVLAVPTTVIVIKKKKNKQKNSDESKQE